MDQKAQGGRLIKLRDRFDLVTFRGEVVTEVCWTYGEAQTHGRPRWTDLRLYRVFPQNEQWHYVLHIMARSILYHVPGGTCSHGFRATVEQISKEDEEKYQYLQPCPESGCSPSDLDELNDEDVVAVEEDRYEVLKFKTARDVAQFLRGETEGAPRSGLNLRLLEKAIRGDFKFRNAVYGSSVVEL